MASKRAVWNKFGRFISAIVVACFFLPFFGVSCQGMDVVTVSGADMVGGCRPGGVIAAAADEADKDPSAVKGGKLTGKIDNVEREPLAIAAFLVVLVGFGLAWVRTRRSLQATCGLAVVGLGLVVALWLKVSGEISDMVDKEMTKGDDKMHMKRDADISAGSRFGMWLVVLGLLGTAGITGLALREQDTPDPVPPPAA